MKLYHELAEWWPLLSAPEDYAEEAALYRKIIEKYKTNVHDVLELGSGGGNNAFHLKKHYRLTLTDMSPDMIQISQQLNPECEHIVGDMREVNLERTFDCVFIHDAIMYITTTQDLQRVFQVAYQHLKDDGILFIAPDFFRETFRPGTSHGGHDGKHRGLRYLEWTVDSNPDDTLIEVEFAYLLRDEQGQISVEHDTTINGIFPKNTWKDLLEQTGFEVFFEVINHSELEPNSYIGIVGMKS